MSRKLINVLTAAFLFWALAYSVSVRAEGSRCVDLFTRPSLNLENIYRNPDVVVNASENKFQVYDKKWSQLFDASAELKDDGGLFLDISLKITHKFSIPVPERTSLRGRPFFDAAMHYFGKNRIKHIKGTWGQGDNLIAFNEYVTKGYSLEQAALHTWTGSQAARYGYTVPVIENLSGTHGDYRHVRVRFYPPHE